MYVRKVEGLRSIRLWFVRPDDKLFMFNIGINIICTFYHRLTLIHTLAVLHANTWRQSFQLLVVLVFAQYGQAQFLPLQAEEGYFELEFPRFYSLSSKKQAKLSIFSWHLHLLCGRNTENKIQLNIPNNRRLPTNLQLRNQTHCMEKQLFQSSG